MMNDTSNRYGGPTRLLHWAMAVLVVLQFFKLGDRVNDGEHWIGQTIVPLHVSIGIVLLGLIVVRLFWSIRQSRLRPQYAGLRRVLVKAGHGLLYACMLVMPLSGLSYVVGKGYPVKLFGEELIAGTGTRTEWMVSFGHLHEPVAWLFVALVVVHILIALHHHFVLKDDTLRRMAA